MAGYVICFAWASTAQDSLEPATSLQPVTGFAAISDPIARSVALFNEMGRVILSPRCMNCHPAQRRPTQGNDRHSHVPFMEAGADGHGLPGLHCKACHGATNVRTFGTTVQSIPGDPHWGLAPAEMAWQGKSLGQICSQIKDMARNGGRSLAQIHEHMAHDHLVGWAWRPGEGRIAAPGTQEEFSSLVRAWIEAGAYCPGS
jgi:hypothetical protein